MKKIILLFGFLTLTLSLTAQTQLQPVNDNTVTFETSAKARRLALYNELKNTFLIEYSIPNYIAAITEDMLISIRDNRKENEEFRMLYDQYSTIVIYSKEQLTPNILEPSKFKGHE